MMARLKSTSTMFRTERRLDDDTIIGIILGHSDADDYINRDRLPCFKSTLSYSAPGPDYARIRKPVQSQSPRRYSRMNPCSVFNGICVGALLVAVGIVLVVMGTWIHITREGIGDVDDMLGLILVILGLVLIAVVVTTILLHQCLCKTKRHPNKLDGAKVCPWDKIHEVHRGHEEVEAGRPDREADG